MSILTKEVIQKILNDDWLLMDDCEGLENCTVIKELARMALAAMDSEPVAWLLSGGGAKNVVCFDSGNAYADPLREVTPLYRHAQPAPVVPDIDELRLAFEAAERESDDGFNLHKYGIGYADDETQGRWDAWLACRAAMLSGDK